MQLLYTYNHTLICTDIHKHECLSKCNVSYFIMLVTFTSIAYRLLLIAINNVGLVVEAMRKNSFFWYWNLAVSNSVTLLSVIVVISMEIYRKHYFWSIIIKTLNSYIGHISITLAYRLSCHLLKLCAICTIKI